MVDDIFRGMTSIEREHAASIACLDGSLSRGHVQHASIPTFSWFGATVQCRSILNFVLKYLAVFFYLLDFIF